MPNKPTDSEWLTYYRWAVGALLAVTLSTVGYMGTKLLEGQTWLRDQVLVMQERGARNRDDIIEIKADAKSLGQRVDMIKVQVDRIDGRMP